MSENTERVKYEGDAAELLLVAGMLLTFSLDPCLVTQAEWEPAVNEWLDNAGDWMESNNVETPQDIVDKQAALPK